MFDAQYDRSFEWIVSAGAFVCNERAATYNMTKKETRNKRCLM
jgi:hypothetical protein